MTISFPRERVSKVYAVSPDYDGRRELAFEHKDKRVTIKLPKALLKAYTLIFVE
jgi:hypothetical protein